MRFDTDAEANENTREALELLDQVATRLVGERKEGVTWRAVLALVQSGDPGAVILFGDGKPSEVLAYALGSAEDHETKEPRMRALAAAARLLGEVVGDPRASYVVAAHREDGVGMLLEWGQSDLEETAKQLERAAAECRCRAATDLKTQAVH